MITSRAAAPKSNGNQSRRGGKRPGAGRPTGTPNRATVEQKATLEELARAHTEVALRTLVQVATKSESDAARVSAASALLDRGYGKPRQAIEHAGEIGVPAGGIDAPPRAESYEEWKERRRDEIAAMGATAGAAASSD